MAQFSSFWLANFSSIPPAGFRLRDAYKDQWVRFHALPKSKRYADNDQENSIILKRAEVLVSEIFKDETCWFVINDLHPNKDEIHFSTSRKQTQKIQAKYNWEKAYTWREDDADESSAQFTAKATRFCWTDPKFKDILLAIMNDMLPIAIWVSEKTKNIFAPYDGGFDLFLPKKENVTAIKKKYEAWLSPYPDGY